MTQIFEGFVLHNGDDNSYYTVRDVSYVVMGTGNNWYYEPRAITFAHVNFIELINRGSVVAKNKNVSWDRRLFPYLLPYYHNPTPKYNIDFYRDRPLTRGNMSSTSIPMCLHISHWDDMYQVCVPIGEEFNPSMFQPERKFSVEDFTLVPLFLKVKHTRVMDIDIRFGNSISLRGYGT